MTARRILVCGGRRYSDMHAMFKTLDSYTAAGGEHALDTVSCLVTGGAPGADTLAERWARDRGVPLMIMPAAWDKFGPSAGPIRNGWMLEHAKPDLVLAFPGGAGTKNMMTRAALAGIEVRECRASL